MAKTVMNVTQVKCDRCGTTENTGEMENRVVWGETDLQWKGHTGGRAYDGAAGGLNHKGTAWLCMHCTQDFFAFMQNKPVGGATPTKPGDSGRDATPAQAGKGE